jgi:uncharacterized protein YbbC (DUF1343 family)
MVTLGRSLITGEACPSCSSSTNTCRPNPIGGVLMEGPILEYPQFSSFVGLYHVPLRFGMTIGELARLYNDRFLEKKAKLTVVPMED